MQAVVYTRYGPPDVLELQEVEKPVPNENEVLIQVRAASVNPYDWHFMRGSPYIGRIAMGLFRPKLPRVGIDVAGQVEAVGASVTEFKPGDAVFGGCHGAFAEYACAPASLLALKPENLTFQQAAATPVAAYTALQGLREKGGIQPGKQVLINGAAGGVGTFAVQIARWFGAEITGVCSTGNVDLVRSLGAERVVDYTLTDFTRGEHRYDLIFDLVGNHPLLACRRILNPHGVYVAAGGSSDPWMIGPLARLISAPVLAMFISQTLTMVLAKPNRPDLDLIRELLASGKVTPVLDRCYPLAKVREAVAYLELGHARGKVILTN